MMYTMMPFSRHTDNIAHLFDQMERSFWNDPKAAVASFPADIEDRGDRFVLSCELPGFRKEEISLKLDKGVLTVRAQHSKDESQDEKNEKTSYLCRERHWGSYQRSFSVSGIQEDAVTAAYESGVLTLTLPKEAPVVPAPRQIDIQ